MEALDVESLLETTQREQLSQAVRHWRYGHRVDEDRLELGEPSSAAREELMKQCQRYEAYDCR